MRTSGFSDLSLRVPWSPGGLASGSVLVHAASLSSQAPWPWALLSFLLINVGWVWGGTETHGPADTAPGSLPQWRSRF